MNGFDVNTLMADWIFSGRLVDIIIAMIVLEAVALSLHNLITRRGLRPQDYLLNLLSGLCLMLALRTALGGAAWHWIAACLSAAGVMHATDLWVRCRRQGLKT